MSQVSALGGAQRTVTLASLASFRIPVPSLAEQERLVAFLDERLDAAARMRAASVATVALLDDAIDGALRRSLAEVGTQEAQLGECLTQVTKGIGAGWRAYPLLGVTRSGVEPAKEAAGQYPERYKVVAPGTVFYNPMRILLGSIGMVDAGDPVGITSPDYVVVKGVEGRLHYRWFYWWLRSWRGAEFIKSLTRGAVRERMLFRRLASGSVRLPPWDVQTEAAESLLKIASAKHQVAEQRRSIAALPAACLREAFSARLSTDEEAACPPS